MDGVLLLLLVARIHLGLISELGMTVPTEITTLHWSNLVKATVRHIAGDVAVRYIPIDCHERDEEGQRQIQQKQTAPRDGQGKVAGGVALPGREASHALRRDR